MSRQSSSVWAPSRFAGRFFVSVERWSRFIAEHAGQIGLLIWNMLAACARLRVPRRDILRQLHIIGIQSVPIVVVAAALIGVVTSQQGGYQMQSQIPLYIMGSVVVESVVLEMGPVLTAIVMIGRVGARITAELGTMKVSEQIDALQSVGRDPVEILAAPRVLAMIISMPLLVSMANLVGITTGMISAQYTLGLGQETFFYGARLFWHSYDIVYSLLKALVFGAAIPIIAIHMGLRTSGGAEGVGRATTHAVVFMTLTILVIDALFPPLFLN
ncbi:MAG: ABC transporter permease [Gemmatimonadetes bacterium]|nr:ABC transporter permease [Gemmatimonadota bacterium]